MYRFLHNSASSSPKGPVYLWARREVMEEEIDPTRINLVSNMAGWPAIEPSALSSAGMRVQFDVVSSKIHHTYNS